MPRGKSIGLLSIGRGRKAAVETAPQEVLDRILPKSSDAEIDEIVNALNEPLIYEKVPNTYEPAVAAYRSSHGHGVSKPQ